MREPGFIPRSIRSRAAAGVLILALSLACVSGVSAQLSRQWVARLSSTVKNANAGATAVVTDDSGNVYVAGWTTRKTTGVDMVTAKYTADGALLWVAYYDGGFVGRTDKAVALAVDTSQNVYVTGSSDEGPATGLDFVTIKYNPTGDTVRWVHRYDGPAHGSDVPAAIAVDDSFNVYVTGSSVGSGTGLDYATIKYGPNGDSLWVVRHDGPKSGDDTPCALVLKGYTDVYVTGTHIDSMADYYTIRYSALTGDSVWAVEYNGPGNGNDRASAMALQGTGLYVTGSSQDSVTGYDYCTIKYNTGTGAVQWVSRYNGGANGDDFALALSLYSNSRVYVTGRSVDVGSYNDAVTVAYAQGSGNEQWVSVLNGSANDDDVGVGVTGEKDPVVLASVTDVGVGRDFELIKYKGTSGATDWTVAYNGPGNGDDVPADIASFGSSYYVTGASVGGGFTSDMVTIDYTDPAHLKYRSFSPESLLAKGVSLKTAGAKPTNGNVRDSAFARAYPKLKRGFPGYPGGLVVGNARPDSAKAFGWVRFDKGTAVMALYPQSGAPKGLDSLAGKLLLGEKKDPTHKTVNNHLLGELTALRIGIGASDAEVTPPTFGDLTYQGADTVGGIVLTGMSLRQLGALSDNFLTYWRYYPALNWKLLDSIITKINGAFQGPLRVVSTQPLVVTGAVLIDSVSFLAPGAAPLLEPLSFPPGSIVQTPTRYTLYQNFPNPFNPTTTIEFDLPHAATATVKVYDILGREVATLAQDVQFDEGPQDIVFDAGQFASGVYFYRLVVNHGEFQQVKKMVVLK